MQRQPQPAATPAEVCQEQVLLSSAIEEDAFFGRSVHFWQKNTNLTSFLFSRKTIDTKKVALDEFSTEVTPAYCPI